MSNDVAAFKSWLNAYGQAWEGRDPEAATALFAEDGTYQVTPFLEPMRGRKAIFEYWSKVARTEKNIRFGYEILVANAGLNIARWSASCVIVPQGLQTQLDGIFLISPDENGTLQIAAGMVAQAAKMNAVKNHLPPIRPVNCWIAGDRPTTLWR